MHVPWAADTQFFQFPKKEGPYRVALANGYIANTWRIQMIQTAKAYAAQPEVAAKLAEFKVVSTGEDVPRRSRRSTTSSIPAMTPSSSTPRTRPPSAR